MFGNPQPLLLAAGVLMALAALPAMPKMPFLLLGGTVGALGWRDARRGTGPGRAAREQAKPAAAKENLESLLRVEPLAIEVGLGLVGLVEGGAGFAAAAAHLRRSAGNWPPNWAICFRRCG